MNRASCRAILDQEGVRPSAYSLEGDRDNAYCLGIAEGGWTVWFSERGRRIDEMQFDTEDEACSELVLRVVEDPTTRMA